MISKQKYIRTARTIVREDDEIEYEQANEQAAEFDSILGACRLSRKEREQIKLIELDNFALTISLPYQWQGKSESLMQLRNRIFAAADENGSCIRDIVLTYRENESTALKIPDMPAAALDGELGRICGERLGDFPRAYAWPALVSAASVLVPNMGQSTRTNVYVALVGDKGSGKTTAIKYAQRVLGLKREQVIAAMAGSAEGLFTEGVDAGGSARLFAPDELSHTLAKATIERAALPYVLNRAYDETLFMLIIAKQKHLQFNCRFSVIGGIVEQNFEQSFNHASTGGLHDRFTFGLCPTGFIYRYMPFRGNAEESKGAERMCRVQIAREVYEEVDQWKRRDELDNRAVQNALRFATICASFDGRERLTSKNLDAAYAFAQYQTRIRSLLTPNEGVSLDAQCRVSVLRVLSLTKGKWINRRDLLRRINSNRYGPLVYRVLGIMQTNAEIEQEERKREEGGTSSFFVRVPRVDN